MVVVNFVCERILGMKQIINLLKYYSVYIIRAQIKHYIEEFMISTQFTNPRAFQIEASFLFGLFCCFKRNHSGRLTQGSCKIFLQTFPQKIHKPIDSDSDLLEEK